MRRKYPEWTIYPQSIQDQRACLSRLLKAFHLYPYAGASGSMETLASYLTTHGFTIGPFPYPNLYPQGVEQYLPIATTQWIRFSSFWHYSAVGKGRSFSYWIGAIVVNVNSASEQAGVKMNVISQCNSRAGTGECFEAFVPSVTGGWMFSGSEGGSSSVQTISCDDNDELYVCFGFCQKTVPLQDTACALSYYVEPESVVQPNIG